MIHRQRMKLSKLALHSIREAVREANNVEACGFMLGEATEEEIFVTHARPAENIYGSRTAFAISQEEYGAVIAEAAFPRSVLGIYHLHFGATDLSCMDRHNVLLRPFFWLIVGAMQGSRDLRWRCYGSNRGGIARIALEFDEDIPCGSEETDGRAFAR
jgi:proteasome lid subunit RPN8/RPN11